MWVGKIFSNCDDEIVQSAQNEILIMIKSFEFKKIDLLFCNEF